MRRFAPLLLFVIGFCVPAQAQESRTGSLFIVARPELPDRNFGDSVVLVTHPGMGGPIGVIINKPTDVPLAVLFPDNDRLANLPDRIFRGGPVSPMAISFVFRAPQKPEDALEILDGIYYSNDRELLATLLARDKPVEGLRVFAGYSGWAPGQLENEVTRGDWGLLPPDAKTIFEMKPERVWPELNAKASATAVIHRR
jgi:putative transcriptional regulator